MPEVAYCQRLREITGTRDPALNHRMCIVLSGSHLLSFSGSSRLSGMTCMNLCASASNIFALSIISVSSPSLLYTFKSFGSKQDNLAAARAIELEIQ